MKFLLNCLTNLTTSEKKNMSIIRRLSTFINYKQQIPRGFVEQLSKNFMCVNGTQFASEIRPNCLQSSILYLFMKRINHFASP